MTDQPKVATKTTVTVYTRHRMSCSAKHRGEFTRSCDCPKWLRYSRNGRLHRQSAGTRTWSLAEDKAVELQEALDRGDTPRPIVVKAPQATIADAIDTFISAKESEGISTRRVQKLKVLLDEFEEFMRGRNKLYPSLLTKTDVIEYRATWDKKWQATTRQKAQQNLRGFLRTCCRENLNDLLAALKTIRLSKEDKHRLEPKPFTEDEIKTLFAAIPNTFVAEEVAKAMLLVKYMIAFRNCSLVLAEFCASGRHSLCTLPPAPYSRTTAEPGRAGSPQCGQSDWRIWLLMRRPRLVRP
jgi:hypothetical protein